jgi:conjugative relaxase-like TrwC/TraI family protein
MLSVKKLESIAQTATYHEKDNYYTKQLGEYRGKIKDELNLDDLTHESFTQLLHGINPSTGESLVASKSNKEKNIPAVDFTFSAPKSVSSLLEIAEASGDKHLSKLLQQAHDNAVNSSLDLIEKNHIETRVQKNGKRISIKSNNMITAKFQHDTSRDLDPQLHTHCVTMNFTKVDDKYRSLDLQKILKKNSPTIKNIGQYYRFKLKEELEKAGFEIRNTNSKEVFFELKEISDELCQTFSNRRAAIEIKAKELKQQFPKMCHTELYQKATLQSRRAKISDVDRGKVFQENLKIANSIVDTKELLKKFQDLKPLLKKELDQKSLNKIIKKVQKEIKSKPKKTHKKNKTVDNIAAKTVASIPPQYNQDISSTYEKVKEILEKDEEIQVYKDMQSIIKKELKSTKLDTQKLFSTIEQLKKINSNKLLKEEIQEDAKRCITINDSKSIKKYDRATIRAIEDDIKKSRDTFDISRGINTNTEGGRRRETNKFKRFDDDSNRPVRQNLSETGNRVDITKEDIQKLNQFVEKKYEELQKKKYEL